MVSNGQGDRGKGFSKVVFFSFFFSGGDGDEGRKDVTYLKRSVWRTVRIRIRKGGDRYLERGVRWNGGLGDMGRVINVRIFS